MKRFRYLHISFLFPLFTFLIMSLVLTSFMADETMTKENGAFVINTTELGKNVRALPH